MANEILENNWKIIKENRFHLIDHINIDLLCNICNKLMIKACNSPCGCRYCYECIVNYLDGQDKFCPGKSKFCQMKIINFEENISIDYPANTRISEIVVKCPNKCCEFTDELSSIESHTRTCDKNPKSCPYFEIGCKNDEVINDEMKDHLCVEIYCHTKLLIDFINNLRNEMESMKNEIVELKSENKHLKEELETKSKNNQIKFEESNREMVVIKNENISLVEKLEIIEKSRINEVIETMQRKSEQQIRKFDEMKEKCEQLENKEIEMMRMIDEIFDRNEDLMKKSNNYDEKINNLQIKIIEPEIKEGLKYNFEKIEWTIENFSQQQQQTHIYSEPFYSHENGYKMCLKVVLIFADFDVYFHLMKGEFDNDLIWPFKCEITIDIINENNGMVYRRRTIKYGDYPNNQKLNKPTTERNDGIYFHRISKSKKLNRNDQMRIKCNINI